LDDPSDPSAAVVVFPGGGYHVLAYDLEGSEVCSWLNRIRIACVLVKYRVPDTGPYPKSSAALQDAQRAFGLVRDHAASWNIDPNRIGAIGFSAGGHLVAALASHSVERVYAPIDHSDRVSCRPDFEMLIYPAYLSATDGSLELAPAVQPLASSPPVFIVQSEDDPVHVENALAYFVDLKRQGLSAEMHLYSKGGHGYGLRRTDNTATGWPGEAQTWLGSIHILSGAQ
jgi:acetyl esterase/lipase